MMYYLAIQFAYWLIVSLYFEAVGLSPAYMIAGILVVVGVNLAPIIYKMTEDWNGQSFYVLLAGCAVDCLCSQLHQLAQHGERNMVALGFMAVFAILCLVTYALIGEE